MTTPRNSAFLLCMALVATILLGTAANGQVEQGERAVLAIPDSLVIQGLMRYERQTRGNKSPTYYGMAFPVLRRDQVHRIVNVTALPEIASKQMYPTLVRHGRIRVSSADVTAQHYGNIVLAGRTTADWRGLLVSADGSIGGGRAHLSDAAWHRETANLRVRHVLDWRTAYDAQVDLDLGRTGMYDSVSIGSHRTFYQARGGVVLDRTLGSDNLVNLTLDAAQRGVSGPEDSPGEQVLFGRVSWQKASGRFWIHSYGSYELVHTSRSQGTTGTATNFAGGVKGWIRPDESYGGALGMDIYNIEHLGGDSIKAIRPSVTAWARLFRRVKFTASAASGVDRTGIYEAYGQNPMLNLNTPLHTAFRSFDLRAEAEVTLSDESSASIGLKQLTITDYPVWRRQTAGQSGYVTGQFVLDYGYAADNDATITEMYVQYERSWDRGSLDAFAAYRSHTLMNRKVPHVADWEGQVAGHIPVTGGVLISPSLSIIGPRVHLPAGAGTTLSELDPYAVVSLGVSVPVLRDWTATLSLKNIANQQYERWEDVREPGFHLEISMKRDI